MKELNLFDYFCRFDVLYQIWNLEIQRLEKYDCRSLDFRRRGDSSYGYDYAYRHIRDHNHRPIYDTYCDGTFAHWLATSVSWAEICRLDRRGRYDG